MNPAMVSPTAGTVRRSSVPARMPRAIANTAKPTGTTPMMSKRPVLNAFPCSALFGPDHHVTRPETVPPTAAAASSSQPALTASQRRRVIVCVHANWLVPVSNSWATNGAPHRMPSTSGTPSVMMTRNPTAWLPRNSVLDRLSQLRNAAHVTRAECHCPAVCNPVTTISAANAASNPMAASACARYWRKTSELIRSRIPSADDDERGDYQRQGHRREDPGFNALKGPEAARGLVRGEPAEPL